MSSHKKIVRTLLIATTRKDSEKPKPSNEFRFLPVKLKEFNKTKANPYIQFFPLEGVLFILKKGMVSALGLLVITMSLSIPTQATELTTSSQETLLQNKSTDSRKVSGITNVNFRATRTISKSTPIPPDWGITTATSDFYILTYKG